MNSDSRDSNEAEMIRPADLSDFKEKNNKCGLCMCGMHGITNGKKSQI